MILAAALVLSGASTHAASPFDGLWVDDLQTQMGEAGFDTYVVANGGYACDSCRPPRNYPADGKMRSVPGDNSVLSESVTVTGPRTIVTRIVDREMTRETTMTVAPDDKTATYVSLDKWPSRTKRLRTEYVAKRVAPSPPGANAVSGSWLGIRYLEVPVEYRSVNLKQTGNSFTRSNFRHGRYTAVIGGPPVLLTGDGQSTYKARVRAPDPRTRVETILLNGKPVVERTYRLSFDGKSMVTTVRDPKSGHVYSITSHRRSAAPS
ncbi:MAG TPA: hypothetical protein VHS33_10770 [Sphingomicrobium sp.]|nr:hypothetical protein [Sphingomicrobium sp.]